MSSLLELKNISVYFNGIQALNGVNFSLHESEIVALMGANGAGKSTFLRAVFGLIPLQSGEIFFENKPIVPIPHKIIHLGASYVPQGRRVFTHLNVKENLEMGGFVIRDKRILHERIEEVLALFPVLQKKFHAPAYQLSGGEQQMVALARGLITKPKVLMLDEPSLGLAPKVVEEVFYKLKEINQKIHTALVIVEHNMKSLFRIAERVCILDKGEVVGDGSSSEILQSGILERVLLGKT